MKTVLQGKVHTLGKTDDQNEDFALWIPILNTRILGVLGDFTSGSPAGVNARLAEELRAFVAERLETWRLHLIPERNIINLVIRFVNKWLTDYRDKPKTTLIVMVYDIHLQPVLYYAAIGDSGLAVASNGQVDFLVQGDTSGMRDAAGFLPLDADEFAIEKVHPPTNSVIFAFSDGLWESLGHLLLKNPGPELGAIFAHDRMDKISAGVEQLFRQSTRKDDLTLLYLKTIAKPDDEDAASALVSADEIRHYLQTQIAAFDALLDRAKHFETTNGPHDGSYHDRFKTQ